MTTSAALPAPRPIPLWVRAIAVLVAIPTLLFTIAVAIGVAGFIDGVTADRSTHGSAQLAADQTVDLEVNDAGVSIAAGPDGIVTVDDRLEVRAPTRDLARRVLDQYSSSTVTATADGVTIGVKRTPVAFASSFNRQVTVHVPTGAHLVLHATNGAAQLRGLTGTLELQSTNGAFDLQDAVVTNRVSISATNGAINFHGRLAGGTLNLDTRNGAINIVLPADTSATYELATSLGAINVERPDAAPQASSGLHGSLTGQLGDGRGGTIVARTATGAINVDARG